MAGRGGSERRTGGDGRAERFPGYDVLGQAKHWDGATASVVLARAGGPQPPLRFFTPAEEATARALLDQLLDRPAVPVLAMIDARLAELQTDGWHYADMPMDGEAWRRSLAALDADADGSFAALRRVQQHALVGRIQEMSGERWHGLPAQHVWSLWTRYACTAYYSHPEAWNEIGFGGPAHPRGYLRLGVDQREPWEVRDVRNEPPRPPDREPPKPPPPATDPGRHSRLRAAAETVAANARAEREVRRRNLSAWLLPEHGEGFDHSLRRAMRRHRESEEVDLVIVGCGAGGSLLAQRMARAGWSVVVLEAGPFWDPLKDWVSDEAGSHHLYWTEPRVISGTDPVPLGSNNSGRGVGGSMVHFAGYTPRFHPSDFETRTRDGVGADWPISYADLREPYRRLEQELPVAGQYWPWGEPHPYPYAPHPVGGNGEVFLRGAAALGIQARVGPVAITNGRFGRRPHCIYRGFCLQGCKVNAKASPLITHVPDALIHGAEIRDGCMASGIELGPDGLACGVRYFHHGREHLQWARTVAVAGYAIETPRLLLNSTSRRFPEGLCNDHDLVGRYVMVQGAPQTSGRFEEEIRAYKAPPPEVTTEQYYETDPAKPYKRGFAIQNISPMPITWAEHVVAQGHWGADLRAYLSDYVHWATFGAMAELLPQPDNRVTLAAETDRNGLPVAEFAFSQCENDRQLIAAAREVMESILRAAGAGEVITIDRYAHLVGGCRMARRAEDGVVDHSLRSFAVPNLLITDGSVLPTQGSANPALTIMAVVDRAAALLAAGARAGTRVPT
ncbi:Choline dehydrogenase-like flavoprotein [Kitasatospora sp. MMS16-BH015]|uniref:GMC family oxidoreductase n=1 Tax=Kitasatospora sp. MMS16-BH015 TaxID=2018025 RepID=UPI000CA3B9DA|nr:GMC family oxidoreductase [Kitasatospora sp. MMS16-BH015]AUG81692.1 Choline dehydrogenase-like flavoprotein [Kitasatospora sp. MMS16-BH015]